MSEDTATTKKEPGIFVATRVVSKILEVCFTIGAVGMVILGIMSFFAKPEDIIDDRLIQFGSVAISTYECNLEDAVRVQGVTYILSVGFFGLMAMIFRNIYLIVKTAEGETWFSTGATPFQPDNVRMVREIGIFLILIYVVGLIIEAGAYIACQDIEGSTTMMPLVFGIIVICLSKMFEYGQKLQETEDGLI